MNTSSSRLIRSLVEEHEVILKVLASLARFAQSATTQDLTLRAALARYVDFCRGFVDNVHHGKEEDLLFVRMCEAGFPREAGPVAVMLEEHEDGRKAVAALAELAHGEGAFRDDELPALRAHVGSFTNLLSRHIAKENNVLYPMALRSLPESSIEALDRQGLAFDDERAAERDRFLRFARAVEKAPLTPGQTEPTPAHRGITGARAGGGAS